MAAGADRLKESRKVARDTEMVAVDIMEDLRQQSELLSCAMAHSNTNLVPTLPSAVIALAVCWWQSDARHSSH